MITRFVKPGPEQDLIRGAIVFPLFAGLTLLVPSALFGLLCLLVSAPPVWLFVALLVLWAIWMLTNWLQLVAVVRAAAVRLVSPGILHTIQAIAIGFMGVRFLLVGDTPEVFLPLWIICVDFAMLAFLVTLFLLALCTRTPLPWHGAASFLLVGVSLYASPSSFHGPVP